MTVRNELPKCGPFQEQRQQPWLPGQKPFSPPQTCANAAGRAPLALGPHQRLILLGHVHALLMCLFPSHILVLMGQTMVKSRL